MLDVRGTCCQMVSFAVLLQCDGSRTAGLYARLFIRVRYVIANASCEAGILFPFKSAKD